jgi:hypothetical protein
MLGTCSDTEEGSRDDPIEYKLYGNYEFLYKNENWKKKKNKNAAFILKYKK